ncbi:MAG TPA: hypothetical protein VKN18_09510 [Blastocatellia bacterium]|nr:hypothetical protein [Blastocatellia bacterium]
MIGSRSDPNISARNVQEIDLAFRSDQSLERDKLELELRKRITRLNDQARIFIPLIALCLIVAIPIWSKSLTRFLILLLSPFVLFPLAFCVAHLTLAWREVIKARARVRDWDMNQDTREVEPSKRIE